MGKLIQRGKNPKDKVPLRTKCPKSQSAPKGIKLVQMANFQMDKVLRKHKFHDGKSALEEKLHQDAKFFEGQSVQKGRVHQRPKYPKYLRV